MVTNLEKPMTIWHKLSWHNSFVLMHGIYHQIHFPLRNFLSYLSFISIVDFLNFHSCDVHHIATYVSYQAINVSFIDVYVNMLVFLVIRDNKDKLAFILFHYLLSSP